MKKKIIAILFCTLVMGFTLVGCGNLEVSSGVTVEDDDEEEEGEDVGEVIPASDAMAEF